MPDSARLVRVGAARRALVFPIADRHDREDLLRFGWQIGLLDLIHRQDFYLRFSLVKLYGAVNANDLALEF